MANANVLLDAASIQIIDLATNTYRVNTPVGTITLAAGLADYRAFVGIATGAGTSIPLATPTVWFVYIKNLDPVATITVQVQVTGGALNSAVNSPILNPGGVLIYANATQGAPTGGIIAITLISTVANSAVELLTAG